MCPAVWYGTGQNLASPTNASLLNEIIRKFNQAQWSVRKTGTRPKDVTEEALSYDGLKKQVVALSGAAKCPNEASRNSRLLLEQLKERP
jgi:hypothetical protein